MWNHTANPFSPLHHLVFHAVFVYYIIIVDIIIFKLKEVLFSLLIFNQFFFHVIVTFYLNSQVATFYQFSRIWDTNSSFTRDYIFISNSSCLLSKWQNVKRLIIKIKKIKIQIKEKLTKFKENTSFKKFKQLKVLYMTKKCYQL